MNDEGAYERVARPNRTGSARAARVRTHIAQSATTMGAKNNAQPKVFCATCQVRRALARSVSRPTD